MALIAHHTQNLQFPYYLKHKPSLNEATQRPTVDCHSISRKSGFPSLRYSNNVSFRPLVLQKRRVFKVLLFKGNARHDGHGREKYGPKHTKSQVNISLSHQDGDDLSLDTINVEQRQVSCAAEESRDNRFGSIIIGELFLKCLVMLRTPASNSRILREAAKEAPVESTSSEVQHEEARPASAASGMLKTAFLYFIGMDIAITIPLLVFTPLYITVQLMHGVEVTQELRPMWVLGPLTLAVYVKIIQGLYRLYYFLFAHAVWFVRNFPAYSFSTYCYLAEGRFQAHLYNTFCTPIVLTRNLDSRAFLEQKFEQLVEWATELYLDLVESIWPYYCRTIRFLKRARLL